jgi:transposase
VSKPVRCRNGLRDAGVPVVCIETGHVQRFLSSRPVKTDRNDARGIAEMMRLGHYRPVHVKSPAAQSMRRTLAARMQLVASQLQIESAIRGPLKVYGLKIGAIHRNRFAAHVLELLAMAALTELSAASDRCCGFERVCAQNGRRWIEPWPRRARRSDVGRRLLTIHGVGR